MPTILLLDHSLSMARRPSQTSKLTYLELAVSSAHQVLGYLARSAPAEFVALGLVGSELELAFPFTQDLSGMLQYLPSINPRDVARLAPALEQASQLSLREFGPAAPLRIVLLSDDGGRAAPTSGPASAAARALTACRASLSTLCLSQAAPGECLRELQQLQAQQNQQRAQFSIAVSSPADCSPKAVTDAVQALCQSRLSPWAGRLHCGSVCQPVELHPAPTGCSRRDEGAGLPAAEVWLEPERDIRLVGFLQVSELYSPAVLSRHLVLPTASPADAAAAAVGEPPQLAALLQAALRSDSYVALAMLSSQSDWYCFLHPHPGGRRCALLLSVLEPGPEPACWLGKIPFLAPASDFDEAALANATPFPVKPKGRPSYATPCVVWTKQASVVADVQKVSRWARKLPEKATQFYQELNRLRRHAVSIGFVELLVAVRDLLRRECETARASAGSERQIEHLQHAVSMLRQPHWLAEIGPPLPLGRQQQQQQAEPAQAPEGVIDLTVGKAAK